MIDKRIIPSLLSMDFSCIESALRQIPDSIDMLHLDIMDGNFVNNITFGPIIVNTIRKHTDKLLDAHLMINNPEKYIDRFKAVDLISFHIETVKDINGLIERIKSMNKRVGLAINPETDIRTIDRYLQSIDYVLIMSVHPGFAGQSFIQDVIKKIEYLNSIENRRFAIEIDGGINEKTAIIASKAGAEWFVSGSYLFKDLQNKVEELKNAIS